MNKMPDRERWTGWVTFAWLLAVIACIGGIAIISIAGFVELPRQNGFGSIETTREPNVFIWAIAIGQAVSAAMLAALFSMINSIYQNSCDQLAGADFSKSAPKQPSSTKTKALRLTTVPASSPLSKTLSTGDMIISFNGQPTTSLEQDVVARIVPGVNTITFLTLEGEEKTAELDLDQASFNGVKGEADQLRSSKTACEGLKVVSIHSASQLEGLLHPGYVLLSVNGQLALTEMDAAKAVVDGDNHIEFVNSKGQHRVHLTKMKPGPLHIQFQT